MPVVSMPCTVLPSDACGIDALHCAAKWFLLYRCPAVCCQVMPVVLMPCTMLPSDACGIDALQYAAK